MKNYVDNEMPIIEYIYKLCNEILLVLFYLIILRTTQYGVFFIVDS